MSIDVEETLSRELREVANDLQIPAMPALPLPRVERRWLPLLVAAVVVLLVAGAVAILTTTRGAHKLEPAPAPPSPSETASPGPIETTAPTIPYVVDQRLYVGGEQIPGTWWSVDVGDSAWLAQRTDNTWWWGHGPKPHEIGGGIDAVPVISPNGRYIAQTLVDHGAGTVTGFDTTPGAPALGSAPVDLGDPRQGTTVYVRAVTNDGKVIAQGTNSGVLWLPLSGNDTVDLTQTAPGQVIAGSTSAGLVVSDGAEGDAYLAEISTSGELTQVGTLPANDSISVSPGAHWLAWTPPGTLGGEVTSISAVHVGRVDGTEQAILSAPAGWDFRVQDWTWEDDDHLVSAVVGDGGERMVRCSVEPAHCVLIRSH